MGNDKEKLKSLEAIIKVDGKLTKVVWTPIRIDSKTIEYIPDKEIYLDSETKEFSSVSNNVDKTLPLVYFNHVMYN